METGAIVQSLKGHDTDRIYLVVAVLNRDFVLIADGKYRKLDNPKQKRVKHLKALSMADCPIPATDAALRKLCKTYGREYAERR